MIFWPKHWNLLNLPPPTCSNRNPLPSLLSTWPNRNPKRPTRSSRSLSQPRSWTRSSPDRQACKQPKPNVCTSPLGWFSSHPTLSSQQRRSDPRFASECIPNHEPRHLPELRTQKRIGATGKYSARQRTCFRPRKNNMTILVTSRISLRMLSCAALFCDCGVKFS